jgi:hypothetical protein
VLPGVGHARHAGVGHQGDVAAVAEQGQHRLGAFALGRGGQREQPDADAEVGQQAPGSPGVLGRDGVDLAQHAGRARRQILEVPDRGPHDEQRSGHGPMMA